MVVSLGMLLQELVAVMMFNVPRTLWHAPGATILVLASPSFLLSALSLACSLRPGQLAACDAVVIAAPNTRDAS